MDPIAKERIVMTNTIRMGMTLFRGFRISGRLGVGSADGYKKDYSRYKA
jgi:hypothetical protein